MRNNFFIGAKSSIAQRLDIAHQVLPLAMPTASGLRTSRDRRLTMNERALLAQLMDLFDERDIDQLLECMPRIVPGEPGWWLRDELFMMTNRRRSLTPGPGRIVP
jgi:hypothetical protein